MKWPVPQSLLHREFSMVETPKMDNQPGLFLICMLAVILVL